MLSHLFRRWFNSPRTKPLQVQRRRRLFLEPLEDRSLLATFTVTNTNDGGAGSLRQAISNAENTSNVGGLPDRIEFNIPASDPGHVYYRDDGVAGQVTPANVIETAAADDAGIADIDPDWAHSWYTIFPTSTLGVSANGWSQIREAVIIDGYTQPGASPNTLAVGDNAVLKIEINGSNLQGPSILLHFTGDNSTVRGLVLNHVATAAIEIGVFPSFTSNNTSIVGNFFNTDAGGLTYQGDFGYPIHIDQGSNNVIGGSAPADRNVIAPPHFSGQSAIAMFSGSGNVVRGNYIGVNKDGTASLQPPNGGFAIDISGGSGGNTISDNVIVATLTGIRLSQFGTGNNTVQGNLIGTNATGTAGLGGGDYGIDIQTAHDTIIGNVISGFTRGINISAPPAGSGPTIQGNKVGTDITGTLPIPNSLDGITFSSGGGATIGGLNPGDGNIIAFNSRYGVLVNFSTRCSIQGNSIFANGSLGISLLPGSTLPSVNDPGDVDTGPNGLQNYPVLTSAISGGNNTIITGTLNSTPDASFRIEFFANDVADPSGFGEGQIFLGAITTGPTDGNGDVSFTATLPVALSAGQVVSATATDQFGNTSEFALTVAGQVTNTAPIITSLDGPTQGAIGELLHYTGAFSDPDPADTWFARVGFGDGSILNPLVLNPDKTFAFDHVYAAAGTYQVEVDLIDNHGDTDFRLLDVTITNTPPVITSLDGPSDGLTGEQLFFTGDFNDPDADTWSGTVNFGDGSGDQPLNLTPDKTFAIDHVFANSGDYTVLVTVADNHGGSGTDSLRVIVSNVSNLNPTVFLRGPGSGRPGDTLQYTGGFFDPDPDTWSGTVNFGDGSGDQPLNLTPDKTFAIDHVFANSGDYTVLVTVADNHGGVGTDSLHVTVSNVSNLIPTVFLTGPGSGRPGDTLQYTGGFIDSDPDTWTGTVNFGDGSGDQPLTLTPDKTFAVDHAFANSGDYTVLVTVADNHGGSGTDSLRVIVSNLNPTVVLRGPGSGRPGDTLQYTGGFIDSDPDTWTGTVNFGDGSGDQPLNLTPDKTFAVDHVFANSGDYTVLVTVADNHGGSGTDSLTVTVTVTDNTSPIAMNDTALLNTSASTTINVLANDSDPDGDALNVTAVTQPASGHGTVIVNADGTLTYTQTVFANGTETFTYTISDGQGGTDTAMVTVTVNLPARTGIDILLGQVRSSGLSRGRQSSLTAKLNAAQKSLAKSNTQAATNQLTAFANEVRALKRSHTLSANVADLWLFEASSMVLYAC